MKTLHGFLIAVTTLTAAMLTGCQTTGSTGAQPLRVGIAPSSPPIIYKEGGNFVGLEADLARALGKSLKRPVRFVPMESDNLVPSLEQGDIDIIMSGLSITPAHDARVAFVSPYMQIGQVAVFNSRDAKRYTDRIGVQMCPEHVGVQNGTVGDLYLQNAMPRAKRSVYSSSRDALNALRARKVSLVICDAPTAIWCLNQKESQGLTILPQFLTNEEVAWAVRRDNRELHLAVNAVLRSWKENNTLLPTIYRWLPYYDQLKQALKE